MAVFHTAQRTGAGYRNVGSVRKGSPILKSDYLTCDLVGYPVQCTQGIIQECQV